MPQTGEPSKTEISMAKACYLKSDKEAVYVTVIEYTDPNRRLRNVLFNGEIPKYQRQLIKSSHGKIQFSYRRMSEDRRYGDNHANCVNGKIILIP